MPRSRDYITNLAATGRYHFTVEEMGKALGISRNAAALALNRLSKQRLVASPARGFYTIVPPEYRRLGSLPADQFVPALMDWRHTEYYAGLLTAAQYHGAAHHRPQVFQVMLHKNQRSIQCGAVRVSFIARKRLREVPVEVFNTPRGTLRVSSPEATALDLAGYPRHAGGLDQVATVLTELAEKMVSQRLVLAARTAPIPWSQRLGYLLELVGARDQASGLKNYVRDHARDWTPLAPSRSARRAKPSEEWRVYVNAEVDAET